MSTSLRTALGRVRGHGAAGSGATAHFIGERVSAIALLLLLPYLLVSAALQLQPGFESARAWVSQFAVALPLILALAIGAYHMRLGLSVIIEDYIARPGMRLFLLLLNACVTYGAAAAGVFAVLLIALGA